MGQGGATESSASASLTHVGQSSVEIGLMNRGERAKRRGGLSFNITRHYQSKHQSSGRGGDGEVRGWHLWSSERDPGDRSPAAELSRLVSDGRSGIYASLGAFWISRCAAFHTGPWQSASPGASLLHDILGSSGGLSLFFDGSLGSRRTSLSFNLPMCRCKCEPIIRMSKGERPLGLHLLSAAKTTSPFLPQVQLYLRSHLLKYETQIAQRHYGTLGHLEGEKNHEPLLNGFLPFL